MEFKKIEVDDILLLAEKAIFEQLSKKDKDGYDFYNIKIESPYNNFRTIYFICEMRPMEIKPGFRISPNARIRYAL